MIILLPDENVSLEILENSFDWKTLAKAHSFVNEVILRLPKFKYEITLKLVEVLCKVRYIKIKPLAHEKPLNLIGEELKYIKTFII